MQISLQTNQRIAQRLKWVLSVLLATILATLAGCATVAPLKTMPWPERQAQLLALQQWRFTGAVSVRYDGRSSLANIHWQQHSAQRYTITLSGPLGLGATRIIGQPGKAVLWRSNGQKLQAKTPEGLMMQALGWQLPLNNVVYWVRGLNAPGLETQKTFEAHHLLHTLKQQGWRIDYQQFASTSGIDLPKLIVFSNQHVAVKLVISHWHLL